MTENAGLVPFRRAAWDARLREVRKHVRPAPPSDSEKGAA